MRSLAILFLALGLVMSSCSKEQEWTTVDNYVFGTYSEMRDGALGGHHRCYRVNFPITIVFPDDSTEEIEDRLDFLTTLKTWKEANPDATERPEVEYPFSITRIDGEVIEVGSQAELAELRADCKEHRNKHRRCHAWGRYLENKCFEVQLPISIVMADGEVIVIEEKSDIKNVLKAWFQDRPNEVPEVSYPISVTIKETGETMEIADNEAFDELVESCKE